jgi:hypothetical protein
MFDRAPNNPMAVEKTPDRVFQPPVEGLSRPLLHEERAGYCLAR